MAVDHSTLLCISVQFRRTLGLAMVILLLARPVAALNPLAGDYSKDNPLDVRIVAYNTEANFIADSAADPEFNRILTALRPDIICFEEIPSSLSASTIASRLNTIMPIGGAGWQIHFGMLAGTRNVLASRYALSLKRTDTIPVSSTRGVTIALADLPNATHPVDVYLLGVHLKCCGDPGGSEDVSRQRSADAIANWLGDARGVARPSGNNIVLPANTPMIVLGDFNLVGGPQPENTLLTGNIQDESTFATDVKGDWDVSNLTNLNPLDPFTGNNFTWQGSGSFPPSALDRFMVTDSAFTVANKFILNTNTMTPAALAAAGLQAGDTLPQNSSDHLPIVMDLRVVDPCATDADSDGTPDCNDGCPNDSNKIAPGICGCGVPDTDSDGDGTPNCNDGCPGDPNKIAPGVCGCGISDNDDDSDGTPNCNDGCPNDSNKIAPGICGCGVPDTDSDGDGTPNCNDGCPGDPNKLAPGVCGCGVLDTDTDVDSTPDCNDECPTDPLRSAPGLCGCNIPASVQGSGDVSRDTLIDAADIAAFVSELVSPSSPSEAACAADVDQDGSVDSPDIDPFITLILNQ